MRGYDGSAYSPALRSSEKKLQAVKEHEDGTFELLVLPRKHRLFLIFMVCFPRILVALAGGKIRSEFLMQPQLSQDAILNSSALTFLFEIDDLGDPLGTDGEIGWPWSWSGCSERGN